MAERPLTRQEYAEKLSEMASIALKLKQLDIELGQLSNKQQNLGLSEEEKTQLEILIERRKNMFEYGAYLERLIHRVGFESPFSSKPSSQ